MGKISVDFYEHETTGLIVAMSDDMNGLFVAGRSVEEVEGKLPTAVRSLIEAEREIAESRRKKVPASKPSGFRQMPRHREMQLTAA